LVRITHAYTIA
jgi:hypothetical protein